MVVQRVDGVITLALNEEPPENSCRPSVDVMLRSIVSVYGEHVLSLILTGMGQDGLRGSELVRARGGIVLAQDRASSIVWGMPGAVSAGGVAHVVAPLAELASLVTRIVNGNRILRRPPKGNKEESP
jgi:two-component system chemotaxis response regulator CheB